MPTSPAPEPKVFVVQCDAYGRSDIVDVISSAGYEVEAFGSAIEFLDSECYEQPGCALLDAVLPDLDGLEVQQRLRARGAMTPVIFMSAPSDVPLAVRACKFGAIDVLPKPVNADDLIPAIDKALAHERNVRAERARFDSLNARMESLTPREREVFELVVAGRLNKHIARLLGISEKTVKLHRGRVMLKLSVRHVAQLVNIAVQLGCPPGSPKLNGRITSMAAELVGGRLLAARLPEVVGSHKTPVRASNLRWFVDGHTGRGVKAAATRERVAHGGG